MEASANRQEKHQRACQKLQLAGERAFDDIFERHHLARGIAGIAYMGICKLEASFLGIGLAEDAGAEPGLPAVASVPGQRLQTALLSEDQIR